MNLSRQPLNKLDLPAMNQVASSLSKNRRRRERQMHLLMRRLEAENEASISIESSNVPPAESESEEEMDLEGPDDFQEEDFSIIILQCPTLICNGYLEDSSYAGMKNFICSEPGCHFRLSGYSSDCTTQQICDKFREAYIKHSHFSPCKEIPEVSVDIADGIELLFLACKCGFLDYF